MNEFHHISVFHQELVDALNLGTGDIAVDCTAGGGGHTAELLKRVGPSGKVVALDRDPLAINHLEQRFYEDIEKERLLLRKAPFSSLGQIAEAIGIAGTAQGICADVGVSSPQIDLAERGFSFNKEGPLDMRMDTEDSALTAAEVINTYAEKDLANIFFQLGEEPKSRFIAKAIIKARANKAIGTTTELAQIVADAVHYREHSRKHPATKVFQALRVYVNRELEELEGLIDTAFSVLRPGGRLAIITFHSLEDRLVKQAFERITGKDKKIPKGLPLTAEQEKVWRNKKGEIIKPFPITPGDHEIANNPRARSAKLRVIEKTTH